MSGPVLNYQPPRERGGTNWALVAFAWSVVAPAIGFGVLVAAGDSIDDLFDRSRLVWIFAAAITAAPVIAVAAGSACLGALRAAGGGRPRDRNFALAAVLLGWAQVVIVTVILAAAWRA